MREELEAVGEALGVPLDGPAIARLMTLRGLWLGQGRAINLIGASTDRELLEHIGDGIATVACAARMLAGQAQPAALDASTCWLDVGAGGGLPGLIVAALTSVRLTLVEPRQRRSAFLEFALASIGNNSGVIRARVGDTTWDEYAAERKMMPDYSPFSVTTSRAVFAPGRWLAVGEKLVTSGGVVIAHLRPEQKTIQGATPRLAVQWGRSRIGGFDTPIAGLLP